MVLARRRGAAEHEICPVSNALKGNIQVAINTTLSEG